MVGRRIPVTASGGPAWLEQAGDYCGPVMHDGRLCVFYLLPIARDADAPRGARAIHWVAIPPHECVEHEDGTITLHGSIGNPHWHGYLERGVWRKC